jgi:hypothetical protein
MSMDVTETHLIRELYRADNDNRNQVKIVSGQFINVSSMKTKASSRRNCIPRLLYQRLKRSQGSTSNKSATKFSLCVANFTTELAGMRLEANSKESKQVNFGTEIKPAGNVQVTSAKDASINLAQWSEKGINGEATLSGKACQKESLLELCVLPSLMKTNSLGAVQITSARNAWIYLAHRSPKSNKPIETAISQSISKEITA